MIGLDTNIVLRVLTLDDPRQVAKARTLLETLTPEHAGYVSLLVIIELVWVLSSSYGYDRAEIADAIEGLLHTIGVQVEQPDSIARAVQSFRRFQGVDFEDCLIAENYLAAGCEYIATFDEAAAKYAGMHLI